MPKFGHFLTKIYFYSAKLNKKIERNIQICQAKYIHFFQNFSKYQLQKLVFDCFN